MSRNQQQQQQGTFEPFSGYGTYSHHQQGSGYGGNGMVRQHHHDAQGALIFAVSGAEAGPVVHGPAHVPPPQQQQPLAMPTTEDNDDHAVRPGHEPQKKKRHAKPKTRAEVLKTTDVTNTTTTSQSTNPPSTIPIIDKVPPGKERRRTQMRIAQRAYRQRKQNELSFRQRQLQERDDVIARMKTAFDVLNARLVDGDVLSLCPGLEQPMRDMESAFESLAQMATEGDQGAVRCEAGGDAVPVMESGVVVGGSDQYPAFDTAALAQRTDLRQYPNTSQEYIGSNTSRTIPVTTINPDQISLPTPLYIPPPTSYSFQETTFARRLMRLCIERAHDVLINGGLPTLSPKEARVFKLAYRIWSRDFLVQKFQMALSGTSDLLDPSVPFLSLGGAGMHYPSYTREPSPSLSSLSNHHYQSHKPPGPIVTSGPLTTHTAHVPHEGPDTSLNGIISSLGLLHDGSGGEWFDVQDIDGYLQEMGIRLEPHSTHYRFSVPANPTIAASRGMMMTNRIDPGSSGGGGGTSNNASGNIPRRGMDGQQGYVPAYVDVERFINSLITKAMCLGRAPGFRKKDVEEQFYNSIEVLPS